MQGADIDCRVERKGLVKHQQLQLQESRNLFVFGLRKIQLRLIVSIEIKKAVDSGRSNLRPFNLG